MIISIHFFQQKRSIHLKLETHWKSNHNQMYRVFPSRSECGIAHRFQLFVWCIYRDAFEDRSQLPSFYYEKPIKIFIVFLFVLEKKATGMQLHSHSRIIYSYQKDLHDMSTYLYDEILNIEHLNDHLKWHIILPCVEFNRMAILHGKCVQTHSINLLVSN